MGTDNSNKTALPELNPLIKLSPAPAQADGSPVWTLYNRVSNEHFRIGWAEFECLARFSQHKTVESLIDAVNSETTLTVGKEDVLALIAFLNRHGLLALFDQRLSDSSPDKKSFWERLLHGYLYFTIPLVKPEKFLNLTLPYVRPLLSKGFVMLMMGVLLAAVFVTLERADEFFNSFTRLFSVTGIVTGLVVFAALKIIHELSHAYTATKYGVRVPHMGIAFIVMYPVLYTETTGSWQLSSRRRRLHIGMAGILAELCAAGIALWVWNISPEGSVAQGLSFMTVAVSLAGSLLVNLNPLMRFDGYYMLCDITGQDNLQSRSCAFARWVIRRALFAAGEDVPEDLPERQKRFLTLFGFALLIYRFFLFLGIAVLVYMVFPKPLGAFLMAVELYWFIGLPIRSELKIWWQKRSEYLKTSRARITLAACFALIALAAVPWQRTISVPAVLHAAAYAAIYPEVDSYIESIAVKDRESVKSGQVLARLSSPGLETDLKKTRKELSSLQQYRRRLLTSPEQARAGLDELDNRISTVKQKLGYLEEQKARLDIRAPFDGQVRDFNHEIHAGRYIKKDTLLFRVIRPEDVSVTAYIEERDLGRINDSNKAVFMPAYTALTAIPLRIETLDETNAEYLPWPELSSVYGGPLPAGTKAGDARGSDRIVPVQGMFALHLKLAGENAYHTDEKEEFVQTGTVRIQAKAKSALAGLGQDMAALFLRESGLN